MSIEERTGTPVERLGGRPVDRLVVAGLVAAAAVGALVALRQVPVAAALVAALLLVVTHLRWARGLIVLGLVLPLLPVLREVPVSVSVAGKGIYFSDVLLPVGLGLAAVGLPSAQLRRVGSEVLPYAVVLALGTAIGLMHGSALSFILRDIRGPVYVLFAFAATVLLFRDGDRRVVLGVVTAVLWCAAVLVGVESFTGVHLLAGRVEAVNAVGTGLAGAGVDATRFLVAPKDLALLCCCAGLALLLRGGAEGLWILLGPAVLLPSTLLVFFSFSRRALLALAFATVFVLLVTRLSRVVVRTLVMAPVVAGTIAVLALASVSSSSYVSRQASAFSDRVLTGVSDEARAQDQGIAFRALEDEYAERSVRGSPLVGLGLGAAYRPDVAGQPFVGEDRDYGRTYVHNFYLWVAVKMGLLGLLTVALFLLRPVVAVARAAARSNRQEDQVLVAVAAGVLGLCAVNWVSPIFNEPATAIVLGCALGVLRRRTLAPEVPGHVTADGRAA